MIVTRKSLHRRTFLKGVGAALGLPLLDAMTPAFAATAEAPVRLAWFYTPNGIDMRHWTPGAEGARHHQPAPKQARVGQGRAVGRGHRP